MAMAAIETTMVWIKKGREMVPSEADGEREALRVHFQG